MDYKEIRLRAVEPEDLELLYQWENDNKYWIISNTLTPFSRYTLKRYIENSHRNIFENGQLRLMIEVIPTKKTIGAIDLFDFDPFHKRAGIGILIADQESRRHGYATMSLECLIEYCFKTLKLNQIYCNILTTNCDSISLFKKLGFKEIGTKKEWINTPEGFADELMLQLLKDIPEV